MNGCSKTEYREENLDDQAGIFFLESEFGECGEPHASMLDSRCEMTVLSLPFPALAIPFCVPCHLRVGHARQGHLQSPAHGCGAMCLVRSVASRVYLTVGNRSGLTGPVRPGSGLVRYHPV